MMSEASGTHFARRFDLIKDLIYHWKVGEEVALTEIDCAGMGGGGGKGGDCPLVPPPPPPEVIGIIIYIIMSLHTAL